MAMYTKGSGADQPQTKRIKRRQLTMAVYNRIVAQTNRRPSANQWQCTQRIVAQTNHRPSADNGSADKEFQNGGGQFFSTTTTTTTTTTTATATTTNVKLEIIRSASQLPGAKIKWFAIHLVIDHSQATAITYKCLFHSPTYCPTHYVRPNASDQSSSSGRCKTWAGDKVNGGGFTWTSCNSCSPWTCTIINEFQCMPQGKGSTGQGLQSYTTVIFVIRGIEIKRQSNGFSFQRSRWSVYRSSCIIITSQIPS